MVAARLRFFTDGDFTPVRALAEKIGIISSIEVTAVSYEALPDHLRAVYARVLG